MSRIGALALVAFFHLTASLRQSEEVKAELMHDEEDHSKIQTEGLESNEYYLTWVNRFGPELVSGYTRELKGVPVVPLKCRMSGLWLKIDAEDVASDSEHRISTHCVKVQCGVDKKITAQKLSKCPFNEHSNTSPERRMYGTDPFVLENDEGDWFVADRQGTTWAWSEEGGNDQVTSEGWHVDVITYDPEWKKTSWSPAVRGCDSTLKDRNPDDLPWPRDEESLAQCKAAAVKAKEDCLANAATFSGQTAWYWAQHLPAQKWRGVEYRYPECQEWCKKRSCKFARPPADDKRATKKMFDFLDSWQYLCEQKLDEEAASSTRTCRISSFCEDPDVDACIKQSYLPH